MDGNIHGVGVESDSVNIIHQMMVHTNTWAEQICFGKKLGSGVKKSDRLLLLMIGLVVVFLFLFPYYNFLICFIDNIILK